MCASSYSLAHQGKLVSSYDRYSFTFRAIDAVLKGFLLRIGCVREPRVARFRHPKNTA